MDQLEKAHAIMSDNRSSVLRTHGNLENNGLNNLKLFSYSKFLKIE